MKKQMIGLIICLILTLTVLPVSGDPSGTEYPSTPCPADGSTMVTIYAQPQWKSEAASRDSGYTYDVFFGTVNHPPKLLSNISGTSFDPDVLDFETTYYWKIVVWADGRLFIDGPIWEFTTAPDQAPLKPQILKGPHVAGPHVAVNFSAVAADPETDQVYYQWDWGDGNISEWYGPYAFGTRADVTYQWANNGGYTIRVKAKDTLGKESGWSAVRYISVARQVTIGILKPGFVYFDILGFNGAYAFVYAFQQLGISCYLSTGGFSVNATVSPEVQSVTFEIKNLFFPSERVMVTDSDMSDKCDGTLELRPGFYQATAYAYDSEGNLIDHHTRDYFIFLQIGSKAKVSGTGLNLKRLTHLL